LPGSSRVHLISVTTAASLFAHVDDNVREAEVADLFQMPNNAMAAMRAAAAERAKTKTKKLSAETLKKYERAAAAAEKKAVAAEAEEKRAKEGALGAEEKRAKEGALGADAIEAASADAVWARERATKARARLTAASAPSERGARAPAGRGAGRAADVSSRCCGRSGSPGCGFGWISGDDRAAEGR
jgi:hypothetical protein